MSFIWRCYCLDYNMLQNQNITMYLFQRPKNYICNLRINWWGFVLLSCLDSMSRNCRKANFIIPNEREGRIEKLFEKTRHVRQNDEFSFNLLMSFLIHLNLQSMIVKVLNLLTREIRNNFLDKIICLFKDACKIFT